MVKSPFIGILWNVTVDINVNDVKRRWEYELKWGELQKMLYQLYSYSTACCVLWVFVFCWSNLSWKLKKFPKTSVPEKCSSGLGKGGGRMQLVKRTAAKKQYESILSQTTMHKKCEDLWMECSMSKRCLIPLYKCGYSSYFISWWC